MKNRVAIFLGSFGVIALIAIIAIAYLMLHHPGKIFPETAAWVEHRVLVADFDKNGLLDEAEIMQGKDGVLAMRSLWEDNKDALFSSTSALQRLDKNKDGQLNASDPIFPRLELVYFLNKGKDKKRVSFKEAGVKALILNPASFQQSLDSLSPKDNIAGTLLMVNGESYPVRMIAIKAKH